MDLEVRSPPAQPQAETFDAGDVPLGKYRMGSLLGRGSFAKVHHARSIATDAAVAIKIIDKKKTVAAGMEAKILSEVAAMRRLRNHPNILKIHEVMATRSKIYLVMELAAGGDLLSNLNHRGGKLPEPAARRWFQQLATGLGFCHRNGVAHRDVKPQNLLFDKEGILMVSDFGLSALPEQKKDGMLHTACGTRAYTAPEVVTRKGYDGAKADAWSCGVILFVLLAGFLPFDDTDLITMYRKILRRDFKFPEGISKPTRSIIYKLLDPNPETRFSIDAVMKTKWFEKFQERPKSDGDDHSIFNSSEKEMKLEYDSINAFDLISLSSDLDLSGLFEVRKKKVKRFTARVRASEMAVRAGEVGGKLGYRVENIKGGAAVVGLRKDAVAVLVEAVGIPLEGVDMPAAAVVEVKVVDGEVGEDGWEELMEGFGEYVCSRQCDI